MNSFLSDEALDQRQSSIDIDTASFREAGHRLIDEIAEFLSSIRKYPVTTTPTPASLRAKLPQALPLTGSEPSALLKESWELIANNSLLNGHPRFWGYITSSPAPVGILSDLLASAVNSNCGAFVLSPIATEIEKQTMQWLGSMIGYPAAAGIMVSGGNMANFVGFLAARKAKANWDIRKQGLHPLQGKWRVYASAETHTWINKAVDLFGLGLEAIRWIPVDENQKMNVPMLEKTIEDDKSQGFIPLLVVGTAGSVSTGAVDALEPIAAVCKKYDCWFHVDGAYGGFAAGLPELKVLFGGIELADSIAIDPHKWLYSPLEAGCVLVKNEEALTDAFSFHPVYYNFEGEEETQTNFYESGFQNSRGFRALKVWLGLRQLGVEGHQRLIREDIQLAKRLFDLLNSHEEIETFTQHLSITTFRYKPYDVDNTEQEYLNKLNQLLLNRLQAGGEVFPSNAVLDGNFLLRTCIVNFRTKFSDIKALPEIILREGKLIHEQMQKEKMFVS
ncbi:MAG TPA: aminotransferase class V-fold PLP-dependent enzyme [Chitinophagaceae bacterium]|nr:aminotransferase class V-fold PLP-dependent enzyme [Chitinophagaceae bacterium]